MATYTKQTWSDYPSGGTPISAARLNHMEDGILQASLDASGGTPTDGSTGGTAGTAIALAQQASTTANAAAAAATSAKTSADALALTTVSTSAFSQADGWTIARQQIVKVGRLVFCDISVKRTGGTITVGSSGNITNTLLGTVPNDFLCALQFGGIPMGPGGSLGAVYISGTSIYLAAYAPSVNIVAGTEVTFAGPWLAVG